MAKIRKTSCSATRTFTDREEFQTAFWKIINLQSETALSERTPKVLTFYGVGGIGKSRLQKELINQTMLSEKQLLFARIDFSGFENCTTADFLVRIATDFRNNNKIPFPHFDLCYSIFFSKKNPGFKYNEKETPYLHDAGLLGGVLSLVDGLGVLGVVTGLVDKAYKTYKKFNLNTDIKEELKSLEKLTPEEIEEQMVTYFSYDLETFCEQHNNVPLLFIDTYECLWEKKNKLNDYYPDKFIRDVINILPYAVFIICGREKLNWSKYETKWDEALDQHLLGNLSEKDTQLFIESCGVKEQSIIQKIYSSSMGHPFHIDLCLDTYFEIVEKGKQPVAGDFSSVNSRILERFLTHLSDNEVEVLRTISVPRFWDSNLFNYLISDSIGYLTRDYFEEIKRFSFVIPFRSFYKLHDLMRENLRSSLTSSSLLAVHKTVFKYYIEQCKGFATSNSHLYVETVLSELLYHSKKSFQEKETELADYPSVLAALKILQIKGSTAFLIHFIKNISESVSIINTQLSSILIDMLHLQGNYKEAVDEINNLLTTCVDEELRIQLSIRKIHHSMFYMPIDALIDDSIALLNTIDRNNSSYNETLFMIGGNLGVLSGKYEETKRYLIAAIRESVKNNQIALYCRCLRKYSDLLRHFGHTRFALRFCDLGLATCQTNGYRRYEIYLLCSKARYPERLFDFLIMPKCVLIWLWNMHKSRILRAG